jgi:threonine dehydratase
LTRHSAERRSQSAHEPLKSKWPKGWQARRGRSSQLAAWPGYERIPGPCVYESARIGRPVKIEQGEPIGMAMLECYEPSLIAWRVADGFMTVEEADAVAAMKQLARPWGLDPAIIAGESGGVGLAGLTRALADHEAREALGLGPQSRIFLINTEGATDPLRYGGLVAQSENNRRIVFQTVVQIRAVK